MSYLLDTNTVIDYLGAKFPASAVTSMNAIINEGPAISVINKIELLGFNTDSSAYELLTDFVNAAVVFDLTGEIVNNTIAIRKKYSIKLPDAIIAATAMVHGLQLISRNTKDFAKITNLNIIDPYTL